MPQNLYEPIPIQDVFFSDLGGVELDGGCLRFYLCTSQIGAAGERERIVVAKLVTGATPEAMRVLKTLAAMGFTIAKIMTLADGLLH